MTHSTRVGYSASALRAIALDILIHVNTLLVGWRCLCTPALGQYHASPRPRTASPRTCSGCSPAREARDLACAPGVGGQERRPCQEGASSTTLAVRSVDVCMWSRAWSQRACKRRRTSHKKPTHTPADPRLREDIDLRDCHLSSHAVLLENREHATFYVTTFDGRVPLVGDALAPCRAPRWGQGCRVGWSIGIRCGVGAEAASRVRGNGTLLWGRQGSWYPLRHATRSGALAVQHGWCTPA